MKRGTWPAYDGSLSGAPDNEQQFPLTLRYTITPPDFTEFGRSERPVMAILRAFSGLAGTPG